MSNLVNSQSYVPFVKPYVEGPVKEYKELQDRLVKDYDESAIMYDSLKEAADNMVSLGAEGDVNAKKAAFQKAYGNIEEAAKMGDYENRGRLVRKAIKDFSTDYKPIVEQVQARQKAFEVIDKDDKIIASEKEKAKSYIDTLYNDSKGLRKTPEGNYFGYNNVVRQIPKTIDIIEKINKGFSGVVNKTQKDKWQAIVAANGGDYAGMKKSVTQASSFIPKETIRTIMSTVMSDPEVKGYFDFWSDVDSYKASPEKALGYVQEELMNEANRLANSEPSKYSKYSKQQLIEAAKNNLKVNGLDIDDRVRQITENPALASKVVKYGLINDKAKELFGFGLKKYGAISTEEGYSYDDIAGVSSGLANRLAREQVDVMPQPGIKTETDALDDYTYNKTKEASLDNSLLNAGRIITGISKEATEGATSGMLAQMKLSTKVSPEEEAKGITPISKAINLLENKKAKTTDSNKRQEIESSLKQLRIDDVTYQNFINTRKELDNYLRDNLGEDYDKYKTYVKEIEKPKPLTWTEEMANSTETGLATGPDPSGVEQSVEYYKVASAVERITKEFNNSKNKVSLIPTYNAVGETEQELTGSKELVTKLNSKTMLLANINNLVGVDLQNNKLGEKTSLNSILGREFNLNDPNTSVDARYVKTRIKTNDGKYESGIMLNVTNENKANKQVFLPASTIRNNQLTNINLNATEFDEITDLATSGTANEFKMPKINHVVKKPNGTKHNLANEDFYLVFDENRNGELIDQSEYNKRKTK